MTSDLTEQQEKFLYNIFQPEYQNNYKQAAIDAGYSPNTQVYNIIAGLRKEILAKVDQYLALNAPRSAKRVLDVLDNPEMKGAKVALEAAAMVLDRVGISKKDRMEIDIKTPSGVFLIPKKED